MARVRDLPLWQHVHEGLILVPFLCTNRCETCWPLRCTAQVRPAIKLPCCSAVSLAAVASLAAVSARCDERWACSTCCACRADIRPEQLHHSRGSQASLLAQAENNKHCLQEEHLQVAAQHLLQRCQTSAAHTWWTAARQHHPAPCCRCRRQSSHWKDMEAREHVLRHTMSGACLQVGAQVCCRGA